MTDNPIYDALAEAGVWELRREWEALSMRDRNYQSRMFAARFEDALGEAIDQIIAAYELGKTTMATEIAQLIIARRNEGDDDSTILDAAGDVAIARIELSLPEEYWFRKVE